MISNESRKSAECKGSAPPRRTRKDVLVGKYLGPWKTGRDMTRRVRESRSSYHHKHRIANAPHRAWMLINPNLEILRPQYARPERL
jgi:hypothetical protein